MEPDQVLRANLIMSETQLLLCEVTSVISNDEILFLVFGEKSSRETEVLVKETSELAIFHEICQDLKRADCAFEQL